jgi:hypothetical protein
MSEIFCDSVSGFVEKNRFLSGMRDRYIVLNDFQKSFLKQYSENKYLDIRGGRQTGKTTIASIILLYNSLFDETRSIIIAPNHNMLYHNRNMILDCFKRAKETVCREWFGVTDNNFKIKLENSTLKNEIVFPNGSKLLLRSSEYISRNPESIFCGSIYDDIMVDEVEYCSPTVLTLTSKALAEGRCKKLTYISS